MAKDGLILNLIPTVRVFISQLLVSTEVSSSTRWSTVLLPVQGIAYNSFRVPAHSRERERERVGERERMREREIEREKEKERERGGVGGGKEKEGGRGKRREGGRKGMRKTEKGRERIR